MKKIIIILQLFLCGNGILVCEKKSIPEGQTLLDEPLSAVVPVALIH